MYIKEIKGNIRKRDILAIRESLKLVKYFEMPNIYELSNHPNNNENPIK